MRTLKTISSYSEQTVEEAQDLEVEAKRKGKKLKVEVTDGSGYASNALRFDTVNECVKYGNDLLGRWMAAQAFRIAIAD